MFLKTGSYATNIKVKTNLNNGTSKYAVVIGTSNFKFISVYTNFT